MYVTCDAELSDMPNHVGMLVLKAKSSLCYFWCNLAPQGKFFFLILNPKKPKKPSKNLVRYYSSFDLYDPKLNVQHDDNK